MSSTSTRQLFGGAITVALPVNLIDASDLRQVPDTQEVFLWPESNISVIVEVLQKAAPGSSEEAAKFHFEALAHDNEAEKSTVQEFIIMPNERSDETPAPIVLSGTQFIKKFNSPTPDEIQIFLALYRVENKNVDLVMSMNVPIKTVKGEIMSEESLAAAKTAFDTAARSLHILDFGLFA